MYNLHLPRGGISDFEAGEFYGFASISNKERESPRRIIEGDRRKRLYHFDIWGDTEEWKEANAKLEEKKRELSRQVELSSGFGELREKLNNSEEDKIFETNEETRRREMSKLITHNSRRRGWK